MYATLVGMVLLGLVGVVHMLNCPSGWHKFTSNGREECYFFETTLRNHASAKANCEAKGGFLAEPRTKEEDKFIAHKIKDRAYIGFVDIKVEGRFVGGRTGRPVTYTNWYHGEPNNFPINGIDEDCVEINFPNAHFAKWNDIHCYRQFKSVCQRNPCPDKWEYKNGKCYLAMTTAKTWCDAQLSCARQGGFVAEPRTKEENHIVASFNGGRRQWIGVSDRVKEGSFVLDTDESKPTYTNWYHGEPNNWGNGGEDCVEINYPRSGGTWNDAPCYFRFPYVCQINP